MSESIVDESRLGKWWEFIILLFLFCIMFENFHYKTFKNNIVSGSMSILLRMIIPALKMKYTLLVFTCMGVAIAGILL